MDIEGNINILEKIMEMIIIQVLMSSLIILSKLKKMQKTIVIFNKE